MATNNCINTTLPIGVVSGGTGDASLTSHSLILGNGSSALSALGAATNGQIPIGSTGAAPVLASLTAGSGITITPGAGSITIAASGGGGGITTLDGDSGSATGSTVTLAGDTTNITTSATSATVTISLNPAITLPATTSALDQGVLIVGGNVVLNFIHTATANTFIGENAGNGTLTGNNNVALGHDSMTTIANGSENVAVGPGTLGGATSGNQNVAIGSFALAAMDAGSGNTALGRSTGQVLNTNTANNNTIIGFEAVSNCLTGSFNTALGYQAGIGLSSAETSNILICNSGVGGDNNIARIGTTGSSANQITDCYIAGTVHADTGLAITSGSLAIPATDSGLTTGIITVGGTTFMQFFTAGVPNMFFGSSSGNGSTTGTNNNAMGTGTLSAITSGTHNLALGDSALSSLTAGIGNHAVGYQAGAALTSGVQNTMVGVGALTSGNGSYNVVVGANFAASNYTGTESSNVIVQNVGVGAESNTIRIGTEGTGNGQQSTCYIAGIANAAVSGTTVHVDAVTGQLGIAVSSERFKERITDMGERSSRLMSLRPVNFAYKNDENHVMQWGLIAEEVAKVMPELVTFDILGVPYSVRYHDIPAILLNELQKLSQRVTQLEAQLLKK